MTAPETFRYAVEATTRDHLTQVIGDVGRTYWGDDRWEIASLDVRAVNSPTMANVNRIVSYRADVETRRPA